MMARNRNKHLLSAKKENKSFQGESLAAMNLIGDTLSKNFSSTQQILVLKMAIHMKKLKKP